MDYSLLLGIAECTENNVDMLDMKLKDCRIFYSPNKKYVYFMSIIDIFQVYNLHKKMEHSLKALKLSSRKGKLISAIPPKPYADRFNNFILAYVLGAE